MNKQKIYSKIEEFTKQYFQKEINSIKYSDEVQALINTNMGLVPELEYFSEYLDLNESYLKERGLDKLYGEISLFWKLFWRFRIRNINRGKNEKKSDSKYFKRRCKKNHG